MTPVVDSHHHFWDPQAADYPWMAGEEMTPIRRRFGPEDLRPLLAAAGVDRSVLVQTRSSLEETRSFLDTAAAVDYVAGVVGWVDLGASDPAADLSELKSDPNGRYLVGIRHQVHDEDDPEWLLRDEIRRGLAAVAEAGLVYDLLTRPRELPAALTAVRGLPQLRFVIDHLSKPDIAGGGIERWRDLMRPFGAEPNVCCKLSGMVTEADWRHWRPADLKPYVDSALEIFGSGRLMFGSDWPVSLLAGSYERVKQALEDNLAGLDAAARAGIMGANAISVYRLGV